MLNLLFLWISCIKNYTTTEWLLKPCTSLEMSFIFSYGCKEFLGITFSCGIIPGELECLSLLCILIKMLS